MVQQTTPQLQIKGIREGLLIDATLWSFDELLDGLTHDLPQKSGFLKGSRVALQVGDQFINASQLKRLKRAVSACDLELWAIISDREATREAARTVELGTRLSGSQTDLNGNLLAPRASKTAVLPEQPEANGLILRETIRSGRSVYTPSSLVIIGDVNPGAELIAGGDVFVWGRLRGLVHAGAHGDQTAVICALMLNPTQLRIADQIAISPDEKLTAVSPEQAIIRNGQIMAEPWQPR